ncbi:MAG: HAMP domain-containing histidine kinase [Nitrospirota bacterium]|nr:MAG: HAMP domain-containing histidine kinase [Nitrospirota bacterium]
MDRIKDKDLMAELKKRFEEKDQALHDLKVVTKNLEVLNDKLRESEELKSNFISNIRNEINNPLSSIIGLSRQISSRKDLSEKDTKALADLINLEAFSLDHQLRNIFAAADIEAGDTELTVSNVDVVNLMNNTIDSFGLWIKERRLKVKFDHYSLSKENEGPVFTTDPEKLQLIFSNLLSNAIEFSKRNGVINVKAVKKDGELTVSVKDGGIGIKKADQKVIFDRFKQIDTGPRKSHRGHGLGLSIVKALAELLQGEVSVKSTVNKGSTFSFMIHEASGDEAETFSEFGNVYIFEGEEGAGQKF